MASSACASSDPVVFSSPEDDQDDSAVETQDELESLRLENMALKTVISTGFAYEYQMPSTQEGLKRDIAHAKVALEEMQRRLVELETIDTFREGNIPEFKVLLRYCDETAVEFTVNPEWTVAMFKKNVLVVLNKSPKKNSYREHTFAYNNTFMDNNSKRFRSLFLHRGCTISIRPSGEGGAGKSVIRTINKPKADKKNMIQDAHQEIYDSIKNRTFECGTLKDVQAVAKFISEFSGSPAQLFGQALASLDAGGIQSILTMMDDTSGRQGGTDIKIEKVAKIVLKKHFDVLQSHADDCETLQSCLVMSMVRKYVEWCMKSGQTGRFDNNPFLAMLRQRLSALTCEDPSMQDVSRVFQNMP